MKFVFETVVSRSIKRLFYIQKYGHRFFPVVGMDAELVEVDFVRVCLIMSNNVEFD